MEGLEFRQTREGTLIPVHVQPGARRSELVGIEAGSLKVRVKAPPMKGQANEAAQRLLAEVLGLPKTQVELVHGRASRAKLFLIRGLGAEEAAQLVLSRLRPES